jgi:hypothetical protein
MHVILMDNAKIPTHQSHLQPKDSCVVLVVQKDETNSVTICNLNKTNSKEHMPIFVDHPVTGETFTKMGIEAYFIATTVPATQCHWLQPS